MGPYYVLILCVLVAGIMSGSLAKTGRDRIVLIVGCSAIVLLQGLRAASVGVDLASYMPAYARVAALDLGAGARLLNYDIGYLYFSKLFSSLGVHPQLYLAIVAAVIIVPIAVVIGRHSSSSWMSLVLYITLGFFVFSFSGLRQAIAMGLCFASVHFVLERKLVPFLLIVALAATFHRSALAFGLAYPLFQMPRPDARRLSVILGGVAVLYLLRVPTYALLYRVYGGLSGLPDSTGAFGMLVGMSTVYVLAYVFGRADDRLVCGLSNLLLAAIALQVFADQSNVVMRAGFYFFLPVILLVPRVIASQEDARARMLVSYVVLVASILFFQWKTAGGYLGVSPYLPFWV